MAKRCWMRMVLVAALAGCTMATSARADKASDTLVFASERELPSTDVYYSLDRESKIVANLIWDTLIYYDPAQRQLKPQLATAWRWVDERTIDLTLRRGVRFQNGEAFDADDVVYTLNFVSDRANKALMRRGWTDIERAEKRSQYEVRIHLKHVIPAMLEELATLFFIYPDQYYREVGPMGMNTHPVGTGPYRVTHVEPGKSIDFERFDGHFPGSAKGRPAIGKLRFRMIPDKETQLVELLAGGVDWIWRVQADQLQHLRSNPALATATSGSTRISFLVMDAAGRNGPSPMQNLKVRRAISHAIDREAMRRDLVGAHAQLLHVPCYAAQFGCDDSEAPRYDYDPATARRLLAEAGYPDGFDIDFYAYRERPYAEAIIGYLRQVGIRAHLHYIKFPTLMGKLRGGQMSFVFLTWGTLVDDISTTTSRFFRNPPIDYARDEQVHRWLEAGDTSLNRDTRLTNYRRALTRIAEQAYWLPLFKYPINYAFTRDLDFVPPQDELPRFYLARWK